jgi:hypothetical protein
MSLVCTYIRECVIVGGSYGRWQYLLSSEVESTFRSAPQLRCLQSTVTVLQYERTDQSKRYQRKSLLETPRIGALMILTAL